MRNHHRPWFRPEDGRPDARPVDLPLYYGNPVEARALWSNIGPPITSSELVKAMERSWAMLLENERRWLNGE